MNGTAVIMASLKQIFLKFRELLLQICSAQTALIGGEVSIETTQRLLFLWRSFTRSDMKVIKILYSPTEAAHYIEVRCFRKFAEEEERGNRNIGHCHDPRLEWTSDKYRECGICSWRRVLRSYCHL